MGDPRLLRIAQPVTEFGTPELKALIDDMFDYLTAPSDDPQLDWKVRHRENSDKMTGGGLFGTAEVLIVVGPDLANRTSTAATSSTVN